MWCSLTCKAWVIEPLLLVSTYCSISHALVTAGNFTEDSVQQMIHVQLFIEQKDQRTTNQTLT